MSDRYIRNRKDLDIDYMNHFLLSDQTIENSTHLNKNYLETLGNILTKKVSPNQNRLCLRKDIKKYPIFSTVIKSIFDDYYCNQIDYSVHGLLAVGCNDQIIIYKNLTFSNGETFKTIKIGGLLSGITALSWACDGIHIAVSTLGKQVRIYEILSRKLIRTYNTDFRINCLCWNGAILTCAGLDGNMIHNFDVSKSSISSIISYNFDMVCGLSWNKNFGHLAVGSREGCLTLIDIRKGVYEQDNILDSAIKALSWNPNSPNIIAVGGGLKDKKILIWNINENKIIDEKNAGSQVSSIVWDPKNKNEFASCQGYSGRNIMVWNMEIKEPLANIPNYNDKRFLSMLTDIDGYVTTLDSGGDLSVWDIFNNYPSEKPYYFNSIR